MNAKFRCLKCKHKWESDPGPTQCPRCGHLWVKWTNYEEWYEQSEVKRFNEK